MLAYIKLDLGTVVAVVMLGDIGLLFSNFTFRYALTLAELHVCVLPNFIKFNKAFQKFNKALTKPYDGSIEILLQIDFRSL